MHCPAARRSTRWLPCLVVLVCSCSPPGQQGDVEIAGLGPRHLALLQHGDLLGTVQVESIDLDRVEAAHDPRGHTAVVLHHGRHGGASLLLLGGGRQETLLRTADDQDLSPPLWTPDGQAIVVALQLPVRYDDAFGETPPRLRHRGELWEVSLGGEARRLTAVDDASRPIGWDGERLLFAQYGPTDLGTAEGLCSLSLATNRVETVVPATGPHELRGFALQDGQVFYVRSEHPIATAPGPNQIVELVQANLDGSDPRVVARRRGTIPVVTGQTLQPALAIPERPGTAATLSVISMPYVHQVYDTPNDFNGNWACGPTSTLMALQHFGRLPKWSHTVNTPTPHSSDFGAYVGYKYTAFGHTFNRVQNDASGKPAQGAYGWCTENGAAWAWRMQDYAKHHNLNSDFSGSVSFSKVEAELNAGKVVVLSTKLTSAGHIITVKGTSGGKLVTNDPYGDRNLPSYPNTKGEGAVYTWAKVAAKWYITVHGTPSQPSAEYKAEVVDSNYPQTMVSGGTGKAWVKYRNLGSETWDTTTTLLGTTEPRDRQSAFYTAGSWVGPSRAAAASVAAKPGETASFSFTLTAPRVCQEQEHTEYFNLVQETQTWFSDSGQGGPGDRVLWLKIKVAPLDADGDGSADCDGGDCDDSAPDVHPGADELCNGKDDNCDGQVDEGCGGSPPPPTAEAGPSAPAPDAGPTRLAHDDLVGGCSLSPGAATQLPCPAWLLLILLARRRFVPELPGRGASRIPPAGPPPGRPGRRRTRWSRRKTSSGYR